MVSLTLSFALLVFVALHHATFGLRKDADQQLAALLDDERDFQPKHKAGTDPNEIGKIACPFISSLANHLNLVKDEDFQMTIAQLHDWEEKFGLDDAALRDITTTGPREAGVGEDTFDIRKMPEIGVWHQFSTAIRLPIAAAPGVDRAPGPNRTQYERLVTYIKSNSLEGKDGCIGAARLGKAIQHLVEERAPLAHSSAPSQAPFIAWAALILSFSDRNSRGGVCTKLTELKSLFIDAKFPRTPEETKPYGLKTLFATVAKLNLR